MRILFLTPYVSSPPSSGGAMRMHGLISNLARRHEIAILTFAERRSDVTESVEATGQYAKLIVTTTNPHIGVPDSQKRRGQLRSLFSRWSYERRTHALPSLQQALDRVCAEWRPDVIVVEFAQMGYVDFPAGIPVILDAHNVEHEIVQRMAGVERSMPRRVYSRINAAKLRREEAALAERVDAVAVTSERDRVAFERLAQGCRPVVVPNGVDARDFAPRTIEPDGRTVLFFGALDYFPNSDAVRFFVTQIWPDLRSRHPDLRFEIVGRGASDAVRALDAEPGVTVTGLVEDVRDAIARAAVVVVPLRAGGGTRLKVLEALAMGKPVVSTSLGVEGLDVVDGLHLLVADRPEDFARAVSTVIGSPRVRERLALSGRRLVEHRYDWRRISLEFERLLRSVVDERRQESAWTDTR